MKNIIFIAPPAAGKGTQSDLLVEKYGYVHISTGDLLREEIAAGGELANEISSIIEAGKLVSDELVAKLLTKRLSQEDVREHGFILDGYPRNIIQAEELDRILNEKNEKVDLVVNLSTPTEEIIERVMARRECPKCKRVYNMILNKPKNGEICDYCGVELTKRKDDTEEKLQLRLDTFFKETKPVIDFYTNRGLVRNEEISVSINRLGVDAAKSVVDFLKNS